MKPILATFTLALALGLGTTVALADDHGDGADSSMKGPMPAEERMEYERAKSQDMAEQGDAMDAMSDMNVTAALDEAWKEVRQDWNALENATAENWDAARETFESSWESFQDEWEDATQS